MRDPYASASAVRRPVLAARGFARGGTLARIAALALGASALGACSADTMRFADPFGNPFSRGPDPVMTGSVPTGAAPTGVVEASPLAPPSVGPVTTGGPTTTATLPTAIPTASAPMTPPPVSSGSGRPGWTALGGTPIVVREGETLAALAARYNVPADAIQTVNGLTSPAEVRPGRAIVIPVYDAGGTRVASTSPVPVTAPAPTRTAGAPLPPSAPARTNAAPAVQQAAVSATAAPTPPRRPTISTTAAIPTAPATAPRTAPAAPAPSQPAPSPRVASLPDPATSLDFRWPARGRVITGFGTGGNEGINIALPEGTPVRAAEGGTVAYAGEELRGYGKLILIRHADGYVSAYAHNSVLQVAQGEEVRRGQVIAQSGRTGNVTSPQLHFEIRQGSTPVDPMPYLTN